MFVEALNATLLFVFAYVMIPVSLAPAVYVVVMTLGSWLYPIVTAWLPHDHHGEDAIHQSKSIQGKVLPKMLLGLTYHLEHHLYPRVPAHNMAKLSSRIQPWLEEHEATIIKVF
jgi:beta-carotene hydroxylase